MRRWHQVTKINENVFAIDPGKHHAGWAFFRNAKLVAAGVVRRPPIATAWGPHYRQASHLEVSTAASNAVAEQVANEARRHAGDSAGDGVVDVVTEFMTVYSNDNTSPADLLSIQQTAGMIFGAIPIRRKRLRCVEAREWKKQRNADATWCWIRDELTEDEIKIAKACGVYDASGKLKKDFEHGLSAIGIALWSLFRL
jgi:hypothetical protein